MKTNVPSYHISLISYKNKKMFKTKFVEGIKTNILHSVTF